MCQYFSAMFCSPFRAVSIIYCTFRFPAPFALQIGEEKP